jgi:hypothetical protein
MMATPAFSIKPAAFGLGGNPMASTISTGPVRIRSATRHQALHAPVTVTETPLGGPIPGYMVALWMIGFEERPEQSAEICICGVSP